MCAGIWVVFGCPIKAIVWATLTMTPPQLSTHSHNLLRMVLSVYIKSKSPEVQIRYTIHLIRTSRTGVRWSPRHLNLSSRGRLRKASKVSPGVLVCENHVAIPSTFHHHRSPTPALPRASFVRPHSKPNLKILSGFSASYLSATQHLI